MAPALETEFRRVLNSAKGVSEVRRFLKAHDWIVKLVYARAWNFAKCIPCVNLGAGRECDFLVLAASSGHWFASLVLLGPVNRSLYGKSGDQTKYLRAMNERARRLEVFAKAEKHEFKDMIAALVSEEREFGPQNIFTGRAAEGFTIADEIRSPKGVVSTSYHIVIGRSSRLSREERLRRAEDAVRLHHGPHDVATYDRLANVATRDDELEREAHREGRRGHWYHTPSEDPPDG